MLIVQNKNMTWKGKSNNLRSVPELPRHLSRLLRYQLQEVRIVFLTGQMLSRTGKRSCYTQRSTYAIWIRLVEIPDSKIWCQTRGQQYVVTSTLKNQRT